MLDTNKFKDKSAENVLSGIKVAKDFLTNINESNLHILMYGSGSFGFGFGSKKIKLILERFPKIVEEYNENEREKWILNVKSVKGISEQAEPFIDSINKYKKFIKTIKNYIQYTTLSKEKESNIQKTKTSSRIRLEHSANQDESPRSAQGAGPSSKTEVIVLSGFRDKLLKQTLEENGHTVNDNVTKETTIVIYNEDDTSSKCQKAKKMGITLVQKDNILTYLNIN